MEKIGVIDVNRFRHRNQTIQRVPGNLFHTNLVKLFLFRRPKEFPGKPTAEKRVPEVQPTTAENQQDK
jgi:hypothetical protein